MRFVMSLVNGDGDQVEIEWSDGHLSTYPVTWLKERLSTRLNISIVAPPSSMSIFKDFSN